MSNLLKAYRAEIGRALANFRFERTDDGRIYLPDQKAYIGGVFEHSVNGGDRAIDANLMMFASLDDILNVYFKVSAQRTAFYLMPFSANANPTQDLLSSTFNSALTEFVNYTQSARPAWTPGTEASQSVDNSGAPATFTIASGGGTVWGAAMTTSSTKGGSGGLLICASKFTAARNLLATDVLSLQYTLTASDAG
jgi:hypothetical protein